MTPLAAISSPSDLMALHIERELARGLWRHELLVRAGLQQRAWNDLFLDIAGRRNKTLGRLTTALGVRIVAIDAADDEGSR